MESEGERRYSRAAAPSWTGVSAAPMPKESPPPPSLPDEQNLRVLVLSDPERGWRDFWAEFGGFARGIIRKYRFGEEDAKEVFQEVCFRFLKRESALLRAWDPARCTLRGFLSVVVVSVCLDFARSRFHRDTLLKTEQVGDEERADLLEFLIDPSPSPFERLERILIGERLAGLLDEWVESGALRQQDRLILESHMAGMSHQEVAELVGLSRNAVSNRVHRLHDRLRSHMRQSGIASE